MSSKAFHLPHIFLSFMDHSPALWWMKDESGRYLFVNKNYGEFFRKTPDEIIGKTDFDFMAKHCAEQLVANDRLVLESGKSIQIHEVIEGPGGERIFLTVKFPVTDNGVTYVGGIGFDVSESRRAQVELEGVRDKNAETEALKSAFISSVQHEIRTPLSGIIGMNELLLLTELDDEQRHLAQTVQDSSEALLTVLNDILDLSKIESGRLGLAQQSISIRFIAEESVRLLSAAARHKGLALSLSFDNAIPARVIGDPERLRQVLLNLLSNAVKFTPSGKIETKVSLVQRSQNSVVVRFAVSDTGIGIDEEKLPYVFLPFWQAEMGDSRSYGGPGLGLPLSKHIVEMMGGTGISIDTKSGEGSTFLFDLPFSTDVSRPNVQTRTADVLIVEDNPTLQASLIKEFETLGIAAEAVSAISDAHKLLKEKSYRLVLCERIVPDSDALEFLQRLRLSESESNDQRTPVVVMSAAFVPEERELFLAKGADDYVSKPLSTEQLWRLVNLWGMI